MENEGEMERGRRDKVSIDVGKIHFFTFFGWGNIILSGCWEICCGFDLKDIALWIV